VLQDKHSIVTGKLGADPAAPALASARIAARPPEKRLLTVNRI